MAKRRSIDLNGESKLTRRPACFGRMRDSKLATEGRRVTGPNTPLLSQFRQRTAHGSARAFGLMGTH